MQLEKTQIKSLLEQGAPTEQVAEAFNVPVEMVEEIRIEISTPGPLSDGAEISPEDAKLTKLKKRALELMETGLDSIEDILLDEDTRPIDRINALKTLAQLQGGSFESQKKSDEGNITRVTKTIQRHLKRADQAYQEQMKQIEVETTTS